MLARPLQLYPLSAVESGLDQIIVSHFGNFSKFQFEINNSFQTAARVFDLQCGETLIQDLKRDSPKLFYEP